MTRIIFLTLLLIFLFIFSYEVNAQDCSGDLNQRINCYEANIAKLKDSGETLSSQTEEQINLLSGRIDQLEGSLDDLTKAFSGRVVETYKMTRVEDPILLILSSSNLGKAFNRFSYLKKIQESDRSLLQRLRKAKDTYNAEKVDQEELQNKLASQKKNLDNQKAAKAHLLSATKNDEKKYQILLEQARAEYEAIQAIIAGKGTETEVGLVSEGQRIANIIQGSSCNSGGSHLHFIVRNQNSTTDNPFMYLKTGISYQNCSGSSCGSSDGDSFNPSGSWNWPIQPNIKFNQGYGNTWAVRNTWVGRIYNFHNGIDINSESSSEVKTVKSGKLYQGSYNVGCRLKYVRVDHDDSDLDTLYLHINY